MRPVPDFEEGPRVDQDPDYALIHFGELISPSLRKYLELRKPELKEVWCQDAEIGISRDELAARVRKWEQYTFDYPESPLVKDAQELFKSCFPSFLIGQGNSPVLKYVSSPDQKEMWKASQDEMARFEDYAKNNRKTFSGRKVKEFLALLRKSDCVPWSDIEEFMKKTEQEMNKEFLGGRVTRERLLNKIIY